MAAAVVAAISNPNRYRAMSRAGWRRVRRYYGVSRYLQAYDGIYRNMIDCGYAIAQPN